MTAKYSYNLRDIRFVLNEWLPTEQIFSYPKYREFYSMGDIDGLLDQMNKLMKEMIAPTNDDGENNPPHIVDGRGKIPAQLRTGFQIFSGERLGDQQL